jgi:hypothetical protein
VNKEVITLWANALDSGEFKQIPYPMHSGDGFDADGVLVELWRRKHGGEWARATSALKEDKGPDWTGYLEFQGSVFLPPGLEVRLQEGRAGAYLRGPKGSGHN